MLQQAGRRPAGNRIWVEQPGRHCKRGGKLESMLRVPERKQNSSQLLPQLQPET